MCVPTFSSTHEVGRKGNGQRMCVFTFFSYKVCKVVYPVNTEHLHRICTMHNVGPTLYKCYTNVFLFVGCGPMSILFQRHFITRIFSQKNYTTSPVNL